MGFLDHIFKRNQEEESKEKELLKLEAFKKESGNLIGLAMNFLKAMDIYSCGFRCIYVLFDEKEWKLDTEMELSSLGIETFGNEIKPGMLTSASYLLLQDKLKIEEFLKYAKIEQKNSKGFLNLIYQNKLQVDKEQCMAWIEEYIHTNFPRAKMKVEDSMIQIILLS